MPVTIENDKFVNAVPVHIGRHDILEASRRGKLPIALSTSGSLGGDRSGGDYQCDDGQQQRYPPPPGTLPVGGDESSNKSPQGGNET